MPSQNKLIFILENLTATSLEAFYYTSTDVVSHSVHSKDVSASQHAGTSKFTVLRGDAAFYIILLHISLMKHKIKNVLTFQHAYFSFHIDFSVHKLHK